MRRAPWPIAIAAVLVGLLAVLAVLQYRWLGEVSAAERERLREGLRARATDFTREFDRDLARAYVAFHVDDEAIGRDAAGALSDAYARAAARSALGVAVKGIYLVERRDGTDDALLRRLDPDRRTLEPAAWPPELAALRERAEERRVVVGQLLPPVVAGDAVDAHAPALIVPVVRAFAGDSVDPRRESMRPTGTIVVWLDLDKVKARLLQPLVAAHFGSAGASEYAVAIVDRERPSRTVFATEAGAVTPDNADVSAGLFDLRLDELTEIGASEASASGVPAKGHLQITVLKRAAGPGRSLAAASAGDGEGGWRVLIRFKSGSLDTIVARSRRRNLAVGLGVLGLLAVSVVLVIGAAQRQQRLARQQMEFVAAVSHELRTPLAVIRSAGENLADGVVADGEQVRRYGALIRGEGRRLTDMVERVMEFAGIGTPGAERRRARVDVGALVADAVGAAAADARERGVSIDYAHPNGSLPSIAGDADALRSAVQNVVGNAIKYSPSGASVEVAAVVDGRAIVVTVTDRGLGIDRDDLPHIFKPFFRGRRAVDAQVRGAGVGLSIVRHVVDAHAGGISVDSEPGRGTRVALTLPIADASDAPTEGAAV